MGVISVDPIITVASDNALLDENVTVTTSPVPACPLFNVLLDEIVTEFNCGNKTTFTLSISQELI